MSMTMHSILLIVLMAVFTMLLRFLPFFVFKGKIPAYIEYLGKVLPQAIIGMLVVYCLKDTKVFTYPFGICELLSVADIVLMQWWRRNSLLSILSGTVVYMILVQVVF